MTTKLLWDEARFDLTSGPEAAFKTFRQQHQTQICLLQQLKLDWPDAEYSLRVFFEYLSVGLVDSEANLPLAYSAARDALNAHRQAISDLRIDPLRMIIFLRVLLQSAMPALVGVKITAPDGAVWRANHAVGLAECAKQHGSQLTISHDEPLTYSEVYSAFMSQALTCAQGTVIKRYCKTFDIVPALKAIDDPD